MPGKKKVEETLRPSVMLDSLGVDRVRKTLLHHGSLRKAAKALGVKYISLWNWMKVNNVATTGYEINYTKTVGKGMPKTGSFQYWLMTHQDVKLPRSMVKIANISGHSEEAVKCFFYRQRKDVKKLLEGLTDLRKVEVTLRTDEEEDIKSTSIKSYRFIVDRYSLRATMVGILNNKKEFVVPIESLENFSKAIQNVSESK